ncbi:hypothetical protein ABQD56_09960 [Vagococcus fluvialis]|uniref:hypothetical protein n=1 Tax=Vagococcus fluvialis TaxID=2738 RepID=UPI0032E43C9C
MFSPISESDYDLAWDFYLYVGVTLLHLSVSEFFNMTPNGLLKMYILHLEYTQPDALKKEEQIYTLDQTPFNI